MVIFDVEDDTVVYEEIYYRDLTYAPVSKSGIMETDQIVVKVKTYISKIYKISDNDSGIIIKIYVDCNYSTEERKENENVVFTKKNEKIYDVFSNKIIGTREFVFTYSSV